MGHIDLEVRRQSKHGSEKVDIISLSVERDYTK